MVFALNALFQWFLVGLVPKEFYGILAAADAPYAEGLKAVGLVGFPIILLCIGIAFGGDLSTINPGIAAPARYIYTMAEDGALPKFLGKIHPKFKTPYVAVIVVGVINFILIATGSINYIASVSLISLAICYMIGSLSYMGWMYIYNCCVLLHVNICRQGSTYNIRNHNSIMCNILFCIFSQKRVCYADN